MNREYIYRYPIMQLATYQYVLIFEGRHREGMLESREDEVENLKHQEARRVFKHPRL